MFDFTTSNVAPVLDTIWTAIQVVRVGVALSLSEEDYEGSGLSRGADLTLGVLFGALGAAGMYYGYTRTAKCRDAKNQLMMRMGAPGGGGGMAPGGGATWPPPGGAPPPAPPPGGTPPPDGEPIR
jgi:hypothetical protein